MTGKKPVKKNVPSKRKPRRGTARSAKLTPDEIRFNREMKATIDNAKRKEV
jgi:hypothetical protein